MIAFREEGGADDELGILRSFALRLEKDAAAAREELRRIANLPDGRRVYAQMRATGEIPSAVVEVLRQLEPQVVAQLESTVA